MRVRAVCRAAVFSAAYLMAGRVSCDAQPVFALRPGFTPNSLLPPAMTSPAAPAFLPDARLFVFSGRWNISGVASPPAVPDGTAPLSLRLERASSITPAAAGAVPDSWQCFTAFVAAK